MPATYSVKELVDYFKNATHPDDINEMCKFIDQEEKKEYTLDELRVIEEAAKEALVPIIERLVKDFANKFIGDWRSTCPICGAINCRNNLTCIQCNCQLE